MKPVARFDAPALDGLRAVAFGIVFLSHVAGLWFLPGGFGVTVFFFLSGYLITTLLRLEAEQTGRIDLLKFYGRRFLRILPPYLLTLALVWALVAVGAYGEPRPPLAPLVWQLGFATNYWIVGHGAEDLAPGTHVYWSLAVEEHFYLAFPWLAVALFRATDRGPRGAAVRGAALLAGCAAVLAWRITLFTWLDPGDVMRQTYASDTRIDSILFGCVLALVFNPVVDPPIRWVANHPGKVLAVALAGLVITLVPRDPLFRETVRYSLQGLLLAPVYYALLVRPDAWASRTLAHPWLRWIGGLSYTLYLVHHSVLALLHRWFDGPTLALTALGLALSIAYAWAVHRWIERPLARMRARMRPVDTERAP